MPFPLLRKLREALASYQRRKQAWRGQDLPDADGLTPFQRSAVAALQSEFANLTFSTEGDQERHLCGTLPGADAVFFIYRDGAQLQTAAADFRAERWDYESPSTLIAKLVLHSREVSRCN